MKDIECGKAICRQNGTLNAGTTVCGNHRSTAIIVNCRGERVALVHNHPSGNPNPSAQDLKACRETKVPNVCIQTEGRKLICHKVKP